MYNLKKEKVTERLKITLHQQTKKEELKSVFSGKERDFVFKSKIKKQPETNKSNQSEGKIKAEEVKVANKKWAAFVLNFEKLLRCLFDLKVVFYNQVIKSDFTLVTKKQFNESIPFFSF